LDTYEAAQRLGVAPYEVTSVEQDSDGQWIAVHEDYASHVTTRRLVPPASAREEQASDGAALTELVGSAEPTEPPSEPPSEATAGAATNPPEDSSAGQTVTDPAEDTPARKRGPKKAGTDDNAGA
jgi:hypothetical protein